MDRKNRHIEDERIVFRLNFRTIFIDDAEKKMTKPKQANKQNQARVQSEICAND